MNGRFKLGSAVVASVIVLCMGQVAVAQVEWGEWGTWELCVEPGDPGTWDPGSHMLGDVVFDGTVYHMYLVGGEGTNPIEWPWSVGHWTSDDVTGPWDPDPANPVLVPGASRAWDSYGIGNIAVMYDGAMFHMWYGASAVYHDPFNVGYATNADGWGDWDKVEGPLPGLGPGEPGAWDDHGTPPYKVLFDGASYGMWYTAFSGGVWGTWRIYADSPDGLIWEKYPDPVLEAREPWEGENVYHPEVVPHGAGFAMWYAAHDGATMAAIGYAVSPDGLHWGKWPYNPVLTPTLPCIAIDSIAVIIEGDTAHGWVNHCTDIYYVTSPLYVIFFDGFETGDTSIWSMVVE